MNELLSSFGADRLIASINDFLENSASIVPASFQNILSMVLILSALVFLAGFVFRILFGARCTVNRVISGSLEIFFIYLFTVAIYTLDPWEFSQYLSPLPFAIFRGDILIVTSVAGNSFSSIAPTLLSMLILCFIVHLLYFLLPTGKKLITWLLWRVISIVAAIFLNLAVNWALNMFLPGFVAAYAPTAVIAILAAAIVIGLFNPLLCIVFTVVNPVVGLLYAFFFSNAVGKQITKAVFSTAAACAVFYVMNYFGFAVIDITTASIISYLPVCLALLAIWYVFDHKF